MERAARRGLTNVEIVTADMNDFATERRFDRVVSVEMFEHMRNYAELLRRIAGWLRDDGKLFVHIFVHRNVCYPFTIDGDDDWMAKHFFSGGLMPSEDLLLRFPEHLRVERRWAVDGTHYARTLEAWLTNLDAREPELCRLLQATYGDAVGPIMLRRWRIFLMACAELFAYRGGTEWFVGHTLLKRAG
ncbi:MAG: class I SAM-dependent methyltransferase [Pirellulales bacterium]